ncbi:hypothetical protein LIER_23079 [Lithospermum erythrorhizon]|uniref:VQ domain-containing protein n=1 Tax=Lithospermum erythrorhizon TaxID=34254 RepID=A0AAV3R1T2_LITER
MDINSKDDDYSNKDVYLKHLNKLSHKITKPIRRPSTSSSTVDFPPTQSQPSNPQPPVYNIDKNDFREVVQRLTGSAVQDRFESLSTRSVSPPVQNISKPAISRLQKIRPPPLPQIGSRGPGPLTGVSIDRALTFGQRQPFSPLPPFPSVHASAESPITAYMRSVSGNSTFSSFFDTSSSAPGAVPRGGSSPLPVPPPSPLPFGCSSPVGFSGGVMFSPTGQLGFSQLPLSPTLPVSSPRQKGH